MKFDIDGEGNNDGSNPDNSVDPGVSADPILQGLAADVIGDAPEVQQHAIDQHAASGEAANATGVEIDAANTPFDPAIHTGTKLKNGTWRNKRTSAAQGSSLAAPRKKGSSAVATETGPSEADAKAEVSGKAAAQLVFMTGMALGGKEFRPDDHETMIQESAWIAYCKAKNLEDIPPGLILCFAITSYIAPRFRMPETQERVGRAKGWIALRIAKWKLKKELKKRGIQAIVTIKNKSGKNLQDELLIDGKPVSEVLK